MAQSLPASLVQKYRGRGAVLDSNLLLLLVVGTYNASRIGDFKRTEKYVPDDFRLLETLRKQLDHWIATPNIITEVDNLSRQTDKREYSAVSSAFNTVISKFVERHLPCHEAVANPLHARLGVTDCITLALAAERRLIVTDDFPLAGMLTKMGCDVININNIRQFS